jgi:hypothetical protein
MLRYIQTDDSLGYDIKRFVDIIFRTSEDFETILTQDSFLASVDALWKGTTRQVFFSALKES